MKYLTKKHEKILQDALLNVYAIVVRYLGATNNNPDRIQLSIVTTKDTKRITISRDYRTDYRSQVYEILKEIQQLTQKKPLAIDKDTQEIFKLD